jgi:glycosyltransferase involved in cell wall biosynthesis
MTERPLFSIVIDNYNYAEYLAACIDSALAQSWPATEVIVVDDGSTDASRSIIEQYGARIRTVLQENHGQAAAFNAGVAAAQGDYVGFLDADDLWHANKVERVLAAFAAHPEAGWLRHRVAVVDSRLRQTGRAIPGIRVTRMAWPDPHAFAEGCVMAPTSAIVLARRIAEQVFPLPLPTAADGVELRYDADAYLLMRAAATGAPFLSLTDVLGQYRRHEGQRFFSAADMVPLLERQIEVAAGLSRLVDGGPVSGHLPSTVYKHRVVLATLRGQSLLDRRRIGTALAGARRVLPLLRGNPRLFVRQGGALALATLAPRLWLRKMMKQQAFGAGGGDG